MRGLSVWARGACLPGRHVLNSVSAARSQGAPVSAGRKGLAALCPRTAHANRGEVWVALRAPQAPSGGRPRAATSVTGSSARRPGTSSRSLSHLPLLRGHGTSPPPPPTSVSASAALTPLQPHGFPQGRHLLPSPADPQEMTKDALQAEGRGPAGGEAGGVGAPGSREGEAWLASRERDGRPQAAG